MSDSMSIEQNYTFHFNESGILYPYSVQPKTDLDFYWQALEQEGYADLIEQRICLIYGMNFINFLRMKIIRQCSV